MPFQDTTWACHSAASRNVITDLDKDRLSRSVEMLYVKVADNNSPWQHNGIFEGSAVSGVIVSADESFD